MNTKPQIQWQGDDLILIMPKKMPPIYSKAAKAIHSEHFIKVLQKRLSSSLHPLLSNILSNSYPFGLPIRNIYFH
jgi:hypothetical protein